MSKKDTTITDSRWFRITMWTLVLGLLATGAGLGAYRLWENVRSRPEFMVDASALTFRHAAPYVKRDEMLTELHWQLGDLPSPISIFTQGLPARIAGKLKECPWVQTVHSVERQLPNTLMAEITFRKPAGLVSYDGGTYIVDKDGYWLPQRLYRIPDQWTPQNTPLITHSDLTSGPVPGKPWAGRALAAGARLCAFLRDQDALNNLPIKTIDVTEVGPPSDDREIVLNTRNGTDVLWGSGDFYESLAGLEQEPGGTTDEQKLQKLMQMVHDHPDWHRMKYLDLRYSDRVFWRLVPQEKAENSSSTSSTSGKTVL